MLYYRERVGGEGLKSTGVGLGALSQKSLRITRTKMHLGYARF